jgi:flagellin-specific chaperone FliS
MPKKTPLLFDKFISLAEKNNFVYIRSYAIDKLCRFIELKTPLTKKTFIVSITDRYKMTIDGRLHKEIVKVDNPSSRQMLYLMDIRGGLTDAEIITISSTSICTINTSGESETYECYVIKDMMDTNINQYIKEEPKSKVDRLVTKSKNIIVDEDTLALRDSEDLNDLPIKQEDQDNSTFGSEEIILEFQTADGNPIDSENEDLDENEESHPVEDPKHTDYKDNSLPANLADDNIIIGMAYICIDINYFFRNVKTIETYILELYNQLYENEYERRMCKIDTINDLCKSLQKKFKETVDKANSEEQKLNSDIARLTNILISGDKVLNKPNQKADIKTNIEKLHSETHKTISDINIEILRLKDHTDEYILNCQVTLEDLVDL